MSSSLPPYILSKKEELSAAIEIAPMTSNFGKRVTDLGAEPKILCGGAWNSDNHNRPENATYGDSKAWTHNGDFIQNWVFFFYGLPNYFQRLATYRKNKSFTWK